MTKPVPKFYRNARNLTAREAQLIRDFTDTKLKPTRTWIVFEDEGGALIVGHNSGQRQHAIYNVGGWPQGIGA